MEAGKVKLEGQERDTQQVQEEHSHEDITGTVQQAYGQNTRNETTRDFGLKTDDKISKLLLDESTTGNQQGLSDDQSSNGFLSGISRHITTFKDSSVNDATQKSQAPPNITKSVSYDRPSSSQNDLPVFEDSDADNDEEAPHQPYIIAGEDGASSSEDSVVDEDSAPHQPYIIAGEDGASSSEDSVVDEDSAPHQPYIIAGEDGASSSEDSVVDEDSGYLASSSSPSEDSEVDGDSEHSSTSANEDRISEILLTLVIGDEQLAELSELLNGGEPSAPDGADDEDERFQDCRSRFEILKQAK